MATEEKRYFWCLSRISCFFIFSLMAAEKFENRRMALLGHLAEVAVLAAFDEHQLGAGDFLSQRAGRFHVAARAALVVVFAADDHERRRFDVMHDIRRLVALPRDDVAQVDRKST